MKKTLMALALLVTVLTMSFAVAAQADALSDIQAKGVLTVGIEGVYPPWNYADENGDSAGYDVEVGKAIAEKLGVTYQDVTIAWDGLFTAMDAGHIDLVIASVEPTPEREEKYTFTIPYAYTRTALIVRTDNEEIQSLADLAGKHSCNSVTSVYAEIAESYGAILDPVDDLGQTMENVISGRSDATLNADTAFYDFMAQRTDAPLKIVDYTDEVVCIEIPVPKSEDVTTIPWWKL